MSKLLVIVAVFATYTIGTILSIYIPKWLNFQETSESCLFGFIFGFFIGAWLICLIVDLNKHNSEK